MVTQKKVGILILTVLITPVLAGIYGIVHDELMYSISPEYFTKYKFPKFGIDPNFSDRSALLLSGWVSTWWAGLVIGIVLGSVGLMHRTPRMMKIIGESIMLAFVIVFIVELIGLAFGGLFLPASYVGDIILPDPLNNRKDFMAVATMHSFSHVGGIVGLAAGILYQIRQRRRVQHIHQQQNESVELESHKAA
jgi:hypothetical protein